MKTYMKIILNNIYMMCILYLYDTNIYIVCRLLICITYERNMSKTHMTAMHQYDHCICKQNLVNVYDSI